MNSLHIIIILLTVLFALSLPHTPSNATLSAVIRFLICLLVIALCVCLPNPIGVPLSLLLVLSSVPTLQLNKVPVLAESDTAEHFSNERKKSKKSLESMSVMKMGEEAIANKMNMFTRINTKQDQFKKQLTLIDKNLKEVKEFYANETKKYKQVPKHL